MTESIQVIDDTWKVTPPDISHIITEDEAPVDTIFSERQMGLLRDALYASWQEPGETGTFVALANVGLFYAIHQDPDVPDVLVSVDVTLPDMGLEAEWLRWCDIDGTLLPTGEEAAQTARAQAAEAQARAEQERERAERLAAKLRTLGIDPDTA